MGENSSDLAVLLKRISELERERDELQLDIEQLCMQQSGMSSKSDVLSQIQERRINTLKLELEVSKQKLDESTKRNDQLQNELKEVYETKNVELENNTKFFQTEVANAFRERDKAVLQVETCQMREKELSEKVNQLEDRMELLAFEAHNMRKVVDFFWEIRSRECELEHFEGYNEKSTVLLGDSQNSWMYGDNGNELEILYGQVKEGEIVMALLQEKYQASIALVSSLEKELEEVAASKKIVEDQHLEMMKTLKGVECARSASQTLQFRQQTTNGIINHLCERRDFLGDVSEENHKGSRNASEQDSDLQILETKEALALALQEKVAALLLLAQQEEKRILDEETISSQKCQIAELQKQLLQVTTDKANVLMELANLLGEYKKIPEQYFHTANQDDQLFSPTWSKGVGNRTPKLAGNMPPQSNDEGSVPAKWSWSRAPTLRESLKEHSEIQGNALSNISSYWISKYWSKDVGSQSTRIRGDFGMARLQAENDALWNIMSILKQLCESVMRLHQRIVEVAQQLHDGSNIGRISLLDSIVKEGKQLRLVFTSSDSQEEVTTRAIDHITTLDVERRGIKDLAAPFGEALLDSIVLAAEICKSCLVTDAAFLGNFPVLKVL